MSTRISSTTVQEVLAFRTKLAEQGLIQQLEALEHPNGRWTAGAVALTWGCVVAAMLALSVFGWMVLPLTVLLLGVSMRALGNLLHDLSHRRGFRNAWVNDAVGRWLIAAPLFEGLEHYRTSHARHHAFLGQPVHDPEFWDFDYKSSSRTNKPRARDGLSALWSNLSSANFFLASLCGPFFQLGHKEKLQSLAWWSVVLSLIWVLGSGDLAATIAGVWLLTRVTAYHAIKVMAEMNDHGGLRPGSILSYTRTMPRNLLSHAFSPLNDNYHIAHHLAPRVPLANMRKVHAIFMKIEAYAKAEHVDSYFFGENSMLKSWLKAASEDTDLKRRTCVSVVQES
jgi:fatty acid desaturase